jgi:hypothetical protein
MIKTFFLTPTNRAAVFLRRYVYGNDAKCPRPQGYHNAMIYLSDAEILTDGDGYWRTPEQDSPHNDPRWPTHCECGYIFTPDGADWQEFTDRLYTDGTNTYRHRELPVGAMYYADWLPKNMFWDNKTDDCLTVVTPGGQWNIDSRANNCTLPNDRLHRCWVRHGDPPNITVDKRGLTCSAGAGSIICGSYHGFLQNGQLT